MQVEAEEVSNKFTKPRTKTFFGLCRRGRYFSWDPHNACSRDGFITVHCYPRYLPQGRHQGPASRAGIKGRQIAQLTYLTVVLNRSRRRRHRGLPEGDAQHRVPVLPLPARQEGQEEPVLGDVSPEGLRRLKRPRPREGLPRQRDVAEREVILQRTLKIRVGY